MFSETFNCTSWWHHDKPKLVDGQELWLEREPWNENDENAVLVKTENGRVVGYVPADLAPNVSAKLRAGENIRAFVINPYEEEIGFPPVIQLQDEESIRKSRDESERAANKGKFEAIIVAVIAMIVICTIIGVVIATIF